MKTAHFLKFAYTSVTLLSVMCLLTSCNNKSKASEVENMVVETDSLTDKRNVGEDSVKTTTLSSEEKRNIKHILRNIARNL